MFAMRDGEVYRGCPGPAGLRDPDRGCARDVRLPHTFEIHEECFDFEFGDLSLQTRSGAGELPAVMLRLTRGIVLERSESAVGATVGVKHQDCGVGGVPADGYPDLFKQELAIALDLRRSQALCSTGNANRIVIVQAEMFDQLSQWQLEAIIETPDNCRVTAIALTGRIEMKGFAHERSPAYYMKTWMVRATAPRQSLVAGFNVNTRYYKAYTARITKTTPLRRRSPPAKGVTKVIRLPEFLVARSDILSHHWHTFFSKRHSPAKPRGLPGWRRRCPQPPKLRSSRA